MKMSMAIADGAGNIRMQAEDESFVIFTPEYQYEPGDRIIVRVPEINAYYKIRIDENIDEALVYMKTEELTYIIPFNEKKNSHNPTAFSGQIHYLTCQKASAAEIANHRNLALNVIDQQQETGCYPHAHANVETRGEAVFAACNAIDGVVANRSHGPWPYQSWGINQQADAEFTLEFGRPVDIAEIVLWTRADFPHDSWWTRATLWFSDGTETQISMEKSEKPHHFKIEKKGIEWLRLGQLIQADDPSPFPALTQIEVYGGGCS